MGLITSPMRTTDKDKNDTPTTVATACEWLREIVGAVIDISVL
jgi:hypothetical protein